MLNEVKSRQSGKSLQELQEGLNQFTGAIVWYQPLLYPQFLYTKGVRYLATNTDCFWLLDFIFSNQILPAIAEETFQKWMIELEEEQAVITVRDSNEQVLETFTISNVFFPLRKQTLWCIQGRLILPTEY